MTRLVIPPSFQFHHVELKVTMYKTNVSVYSIHSILDKMSCFGVDALNWIQTIIPLYRSRKGWSIK